VERITKEQKIIQMTRSKVVYLPKIVEKYGFSSNQPILVTIEKNKIIIEPQKLYKSRIKVIREENGAYKVIPFEKGEEKLSTQLEDLETLTQGQKVISFAKDHKNNKIFMYYLIINEKKEILQQIKGNYVSVLAMEDMKKGKAPEYYIS